MCVECTINSDCDSSIVGPICNRDTSISATTPSLWGPKLSNGDPCSTWGTDDNCESNICGYVGTSLKCVECLYDMDCIGSIGGPRCVIDSSISATTPHFCGPEPSSVACSSGGDCASTHCTYNGASPNMMCVDCILNSHCTGSAGGPRCDVIDPSPSNRAPWFCGPLGNTGEFCFMDSDCVSGSCLFPVVVEPGPFIPLCA